MNFEKQKKLHQYKNLISINMNIKKYSFYGSVYNSINNSVCELIWNSVYKLVYRLSLNSIYTSSVRHLVDGSIDKDLLIKRVCKEYEY